MIKNIIFDIGQVLAQFRWQEFIEGLGYSEEINTRIAKATVLSPAWNEFDRGAMTDEQVIALCVSYDPEIELQIRHFFKSPAGLVTEFSYARSWLTELKKKGYHTYILSNYGETNFSYIRNRFRFFEEVDGMVISFQYHQIKPEPEIYETLLGHYHLKAEECVFIDDRKENITAANTCGIRGIWFQSYEQAKKELDQILSEL